MTVNQSKVLNVKMARESNDERHLCPLQLDVIERALIMWSNPNDVVLSPFMGIGSEGVTSLKLGRRFVGTELKESYFKQASRYLEAQDQQVSLFEREIAAA
jgi:DNA modification methylase